MSEYQITNIHPPARDHERITHVYAQGFARWLSTGEAISFLRAKTCNFYVRGPRGEKAYVGVFQVAGRQPYLRTHADGRWDDNLLALPGGRQAA